MSGGLEVRVHVPRRLPGRRRLLTAFVDGRIQPLRFRWQGRVVRVRRVTGEWKRREGSTLLRYFSIESHASDTYELCYDPRGPRWVLSRAWTGAK